MGASRRLSLIPLVFTLLFASYGMAAEAEGRMNPSSDSSRFQPLPLRKDIASTEIASPALVWGTIVLATLGAVAALLVRGRSPGTRWFRRPLLAESMGSPRVVGSKAITQHASLHVIEWFDERLLVAATPSGVTVISRKSVPASVNDEA